MADGSASTPPGGRMGTGPRNSSAVDPLPSGCSRPAFVMRLTASRMVRRSTSSFAASARWLRGRTASASRIRASTSSFDMLLPVLCVAPLEGSGVNTAAGPSCAPRKIRGPSSDVRIAGVRVLAAGRRGPVGEESACLSRLAPLPDVPLRLRACSVGVRGADGGPSPRSTSLPVSSGEGLVDNAGSSDPPPAGESTARTQVATAGW